MTIHPACFTENQLLRDCEIKRTRRSGPGGQHRNKVETAIVITHLPSKIQAEANERRSQEENRKVAIQRLRIRLAIELRCVLNEPAITTELWKSRCQRGKIEVSINHVDYPAILAEALDAIFHFIDDWKQVTEFLGCISSQLIKFLKKEPQALAAVNQLRLERGMKKFQ